MCIFINLLDSHMNQILEKSVQELYNLYQDVATVRYITIIKGKKKILLRPSLN